MDQPLDSEALHDRDWSEKKESDSFFTCAPRYPDIVNEVLRLNPRMLLDVGCGSGYMAKLLKSQNSELIVHGVDISGVALERANIHLARSWKVDIDKDNMPISSCYYDSVICVEVLEHLYDPDHCLQDIFRVLKPGGHLVVTVPNIAYWRYRIQLMMGNIPNCAADPRHLHQFNLILLRKVAVSAGFKLISVTGHAVRMPWFAQRWPAIFSDILIATVQKPEFQE